MEIDDSLIVASSSSTVKIPGFDDAIVEVGDDDQDPDDTPELIIDDESVASVNVETPSTQSEDGHTTIKENVGVEGTSMDTSNATCEPTDNTVGEEKDDDDVVIINEVVPEQINLDEYEFKRPIDDEEVIAAFVIKKEPNDDNFMDAETFKNIKIKQEPITPGKSVFIYHC